MEHLAEAACSAVSERRRARVLLVDDRPENLAVLQAVLADADAELVPALSGADALRHVLHHDFAVILLDVDMPGMDGYETAELIRSREWSRHTPIVFVTAAGMSSEHVSRGYAVGALDYLIKPVVPQILRAKVEAFLERWRARQALEMEVRQRRAAEAAVRELNADLERRVEERTTALAVANWDLAMEVAERQRAQAELAAGYERLRKLEQLRDSLTQMVVHDMRTPLTSFLTGLETLLELGPLNEGQRECLDMAVQGGETLLTMINDVLDVNKLEEGAVPLHRALLSVRELLHEALAQVESLAHAKGVVLSAHPEEGLPEIQADRDKLCRTLVNLLGNAVKFTPRNGQVSITASIVLGELRISVADTGEGIPHEAFNRIFEKFGQVEERREGRLRSTGLGLTFCKLAVEAHGGRIWVESEPGIGSTFTLAIPLQHGAIKALPNPEPVPPVENRAGAPFPPRRARPRRPRRQAAVA